MIALSFEMVLKDQTRNSFQVNSLEESQEKYLGKALNVIRLQSQQEFTEDHIRYPKWHFEDQLETCRELENPHKIKYFLF